MPMALPWESGFLHLSLYFDFWATYTYELRLLLVLPPFLQSILSFTGMLGHSSVGFGVLTATWVEHQGISSFRTSGIFNISHPIQVACFTFRFKWRLSFYAGNKISFILQTCLDNLFFPTFPYTQWRKEPFEKNKGLYTKKKKKKFKYDSIVEVEMPQDWVLVQAKCNLIIH